MELYDRFQDDLRVASTGINDWQQRALRAHAFMAGGHGQWDAEDIRKMEKEKRAPVTFNQIRPTIGSVTGSQSIGRFKAKFRPRTASRADIDSLAAEAANEMHRWAWQRSDTEFEVGRAAADMAITGLGWTQTYMDYMENPEGEPRTVWVPGFEMAPDPTAKSLNLRDSKYMIRGRWMQRTEMLAMFGQRAADAINSGGMGDDFFAGFAGLSSTEGYDYEDRVELSAIWNRRSDEVLVYEYQYFDIEQQIRLYVPGSDPIWVEPKDAQVAILQLAEAAQVPIEQIAAVQMPRKVYRRSFFFGKAELKTVEIPWTSFTYLAMTGFDDQSKRGEVTWQGLESDLEDAQKVLNKAVSQLIYYISLSPSALIAEEGSISNRAQFQRDINNPSGTVFVAPGALSQGRIRERLGNNPVPNGLPELIGIGRQAFQWSSGVSPFMSGMVGNLSRTAGNAVNAVQQASMLVLSRFNDSMRLHRKDEAKLVLNHVLNYMTPQMVARVIGPDLAQQGAAEAMFQRDVMSYDLVVDETPATPNEKAEVFKNLVDSGIIQMIVQQLGRIPASVFQYLDIPSSMADELTEAYGQAAAQAQAQQAAVPQQ